MIRRLTVLGAAAVLGACASMSAPTVPSQLQAPAGEKLASMASAKGVQIYRCVPTAADATKNEWRFINPEATLFDRSGAEIGTHAGSPNGPVWTAKDGSSVTGRMKASANAPGYAIPWLLLERQGASGSGMFSNVTSIQRVNTSGGRPPEGACSNNQKDLTIRVNYTADYYYYTK
jgi:hypothetical protein